VAAILSAWRPTRAQLITVTGLAVLAIAAWTHMAVEARQFMVTGVCQCLGMQMSAPDMTHWQVASLIPLFVMWSEMMVAMMLPSAAPMILMVSRLAPSRAHSPRTVTWLFVAGYLAVWSGYSALAAVAQWFLHERALLSPGMVAQSRYFSAALLIAAGVFQWTPLKRACLVKCRSPLAFIMTRWRFGPGGAFRMGAEHGLYCAGCCGILMLLLFVAGVMNLWWIAFLTLLVLVEKMAPRAELIAKGIGAALVIWGVLLLFA
jgi:predicted metal-binding membrane protein